MTGAGGNRQNLITWYGRGFPPDLFCDPVCVSVCVSFPAPKFMSIKQTEENLRNCYCVSGSVTSLGISESCCFCMTHY